MSSAKVDLFEHIGRRIAALRHARGWTQERLAEASTMSAPYLARIETGAREPTLRTLEAIGNALDVPVQRLFDSDDASGIPVDLRTAIEGLDASDLKLIVSIATRLQSGEKRVRAKRTR